MLHIIIFYCSLNTAHVWIYYCVFQEPNITVTLRIYEKDNWDQLIHEHHMIRYTKRALKKLGITYKKQGMIYGYDSAFNSQYGFLMLLPETNHTLAVELAAKPCKGRTGLICIWHADEMAAVVVCSMCG